MKAKYGKNDSYELHHNIDAYRKSLFISTLNKFKDNLKMCIRNRFRKANDIQRILFNLDMVYSGKAILKIVSNPKPWRLRFHFIKKVKWESLCDTENSKKLHGRLTKYKPKFFCINSNADCTADEKIKNKQFMETLFPRPSKFEKSFLK